MEYPLVEQLIPSLAQSLTPRYPEFISKFTFSEGEKEIDSLLNNRCDAQTEYKVSKHPCIRTHVVLMTPQGKHSMEQIRKMTAWETHFPGYSRWNRACQCKHQGVTALYQLKHKPVSDMTLGGSPGSKLISPQFAFSDGQPVPTLQDTITILGSS